MADALYSFRHYERAAHLEPYDIVSTRNGGFIEVWEVELLDHHVLDERGDTHGRETLVLVTPRGDNHARLAFGVDERVEFLRPHVIPER